MAGIRISPEVITKTPQEVKKVPMSFEGPELQAGETITSVEGLQVIPSGGNPHLEATTAPSGVDVILTLTFGQPATDYLVILLGVTSAGQKLHQAGRIRVDNAT